MPSKNIPQCHPEEPYFARHLCRSCYRRHSKAGTLNRFPRVTVPDDHFAARYTEMRAAGLSRDAVAEQLGMDRHAVDQAYHRAVHLGEIAPDGPRVVCGTEAGYNAHRRREEPSCQPCKDDHAAAVRDRYRSVRRARDLEQRADEHTEVCR